MTTVEEVFAQTQMEVIIHFDEYGETEFNQVFFQFGLDIPAHQRPEVSYCEHKGVDFDDNIELIFEDKELKEFAILTLQKRAKQILEAVKGFRFQEFKEYKLSRNFNLENVFEEVKSLIEDNYNLSERECRAIKNKKMDGRKVYDGLIGKGIISNEWDEDLFFTPKGMNIYLNMRNKNA